MPAKKLRPRGHKWVAAENDEGELSPLRLTCRITNCPLKAVYPETVCEKCREQLAGPGEPPAQEDRAYAGDDWRLWAWISGLMVAVILVTWALTTFGPKP